jgi:hypothetical protein
MAQVDTNIAMGFRPIQIPLEESPLNRLRERAEFENSLLKSQEIQRGMQQRNALARINATSGLEIGSPEYFNRVQQDAPDLIEDVLSRQLKRQQLREAQETANLKQKKLEREQLAEAKKSLTGLTSLDQARADIYDGIQSGLLTAEQGEALRAGLPMNEEEFPAWKQRTLLGYLTAEKQLEFTQPKPEKLDLNGKIVMVDMNPNSTTFKQVIREDVKTAAPAAPSKVVQLQSELANAEKTYGVNSPQAKQIRDEIEQETGGLERQRIAIDRYRSRKGEGGGVNAPGPGTKLEKGERWNAEEQRIETVPGSKLFVAQSGAHGKDRAALVAVETKTKSAVNKINEILDPKNATGFDANFSSTVPYSGFVTGRLAPDSRRRIESLKSDMKAAGLELIRAGGQSIGQITEREWPILENMIAGISPEMTPAAARAEFKKVAAYMERLKDNAKEAYQTEWGDTQYFKPVQGDKPSRELTAQDKEALKWANNNPKDPRAAQIKQRLGVKP